MMDTLSVVNTCIGAAQLVREALRRDSKGNLQVGIAGWFPDTDPIFRALVFWKHEDGSITLLHPSVYGQFNLTFINHRTDRKERLLAARLVLESRFLGRRNVLGTAQVKIYSRRSHLEPLENIVFEPLSAPQTFTLIADGRITCPVQKLPRRSRFVLEMDFAGPARKIRRTLDDVRHDPQLLHRVGVGA